MARTGSLKEVRVKLSWSEEINDSQFKVLVALSRKCSAARAAVHLAERAYQEALGEFAEPFITSKLAGLGLSGDDRLDQGVRMGNEFSANPQPRLDIFVSNEPRHHVMPVLDKS